MADASAIGTTVLQIKEIPSRPSEFDGALCLFNLAAGVDEREVRKQLQTFGDIMSYEAEAGCTPAIVRFSSHDAALAAKRAASELTSFYTSGIYKVTSDIDTVYNERSYDGRHGEEGLDNDNGRGW